MIENAPMKVEILTEDDRWSSVDLLEIAMVASGQISHHLGLKDDAFSVDILACDDAKIAQLNHEFRDKPQPTNVLSWPSEERAAEYVGEAPEPPDPHIDSELGDIAIAYETCLREAKESHKEFNDHLTHLIIHAILHLLGYDHIEDEDAALMEGIEIAILENMGISNPYEIDETE